MPPILIGALIVGALWYLSQKAGNSTFLQQNPRNRPAENAAQGIQALPNAIGQAGGLFTQARKTTRDFSTQNALDTASSAVALTKQVGSVLPGIFKDLGLSQSVAGTGGATPGSVQDAQDLQAASANYNAAMSALSNVWPSVGSSGGTGSEQSAQPQIANDLGVDSLGLIDYANTQQPGSVAGSAMPYENGYSDSIPQTAETPQFEDGWTFDQASTNPPPVDGSTPTGSGQDVPITDGPVYETLSDGTMVDSNGVYQG